MNSKRNILPVVTLSAALALSGMTAALAQGNDFFGSSSTGPGSRDPNQQIPGAQAAEQTLNNNPGDYTSDEKRMQKKYKANIVLAQRLVSKADRMIKDGEKRKNDKWLKKGKILKEIAEKRLAQLKESNPVPDAPK